MKSKCRAFALFLSFILILQIVPTLSAASQSAQQAIQPTEQYAAKVRDRLKLNEEQVGQLRQALAKHEPKITELRRRAQTNPYTPGLVPEIEKEQSAIRDEIAEFLNDEQKQKLSSVEPRTMFSLPPAFVPANIPPRARMEATQLNLASRERLLASLPSSNKARLTDDQKILQLLNRITFGPRPGDIARLKQTGIDKFLEEQLRPEMIDDSELDKRLAVLPTQQMTAAEAYQFYPQQNVADQRANEKNPPPVYGRQQQVTGELIQQKLVRAVSSNRQLQEVMVDFWFNHFNVLATKDSILWTTPTYEREVIRPLALGKFRDLLLATAQSPAMLYYLDNWLSAAPDAKEPRPQRPASSQPAQPKPATKPAPGASSEMATPAQPQAPTEGGKIVDDAMLLAKTGGSARMATIEPQTSNAKPPVPNAKPEASGAQPQPAAQPQRRRGINENYARELMELHTLGVDGGYTQKDVQEVARCLTGWTIDRPFQGGSFVFRPWMHDAGSKTVLGVNIPAGGGVSDGLRVIELLSRHPSTARFISKKLCERFIADDPPPQAVERAAQVFLKTDGDIREVLRAILTSPEFYAVTAFRAKVKSPLELAASAIRALDGDTNGATALHDWLRKMGEPLYQYAFPTGYSERSAAWMNTGVFLNRLNFVVAVANNQIAGTSYDPARLTSADASADETANQLSALIVRTELSAESRRAVMDAIAQQTTASATGKPDIIAVKSPAQTDANAARRRVAQMVGLLFGTAEFQRR